VRFTLLKSHLHSQKWNSRLNGLLYIWATVWTAFPFVGTLAATDDNRWFVVFISWFGALLTILVLVFLTVLVWRGSTDSGAESTRMASYGFPRLARAHPVLAEFGALALLGIVVPSICGRIRYPAALSAALYAVLAYGYLLQPTEPAREKPDPTGTVRSPLPAQRYWSSTPLATLVGLAIALLFPMPPYRQPLLHLLIVYAGVSPMSAWEMIGTVFKITTIAAIPFIVIQRERRPLESIGWRTPRLKDVVFGVAAFLMMQEVYLLTWSLALNAIPSAVAETRAGNVLYRSVPLSLSLLGAIANAIAEEVGFRGYALERLREIVGSTWLGAGIPYVVEVLCHAPTWGFHGMLLKAPMLLILVLLYLWQRSLAACIFAHLVADVIPIFW